MSENNTISVSVNNPSQEIYIPHFGEGRYKSLCQEIYRDSKQVFSLSPKVAEQLAKNIASELGIVCRDSRVLIRLGRLSKDGACTLKESVDAIKGVTMTLPLSCLRALNYANEADKFGFSRSDTKWHVDSTIREYLRELEDKH